MPQIALLLSTLIWGATFPATKAVLEQIPPFAFLFLRFLLGTTLALGIILAMGGRLSFERGTLRRSAIATVPLVFGYTLQTVGLRDTTASNSAFITALYVVFVPLLLRRFGGGTWASAGIAVAGLWFLVNPSVSMNPGDLLTLACAAAFAAHMGCLERYTQHGDSTSLFLWQLVFITAAMFPAMLIEWPGGARVVPGEVLLVGLAVTGVLATGAFAVQVWAQRLLPAQRVALIFSLEPACAAWLAWYFLGERLGADGWLGSALILLALIIGAYGAADQGRAAQPDLLRPAAEGAGPLPVSERPSGR